MKDGFTAMEKLLGLAASIPDFSDIDLDSYSHILLSAEQWINDFEKYLRSAKNKAKHNLTGKQLETETAM